MQRLTRLPLLLGQVSKYTEDSSAEARQVKQAQTSVEQLLLATNQAIKDEEDYATLTRLSEDLHFPNSDVQLDLTQRSRLVGQRRIIRHGELSKGLRRKPVQAWLFNDMLLLVRDDGQTISHDVSHSSCILTLQWLTSEYRQPIPLEECSIKDLGGEENFQIAHKGSTVLLRTATPRLCAQWLKDIHQHRQSCLDEYKKKGMSY